jgi:hypothetical protein
MLRRAKKKLENFKNSILPPHIPSRVVSYIEQLLAGKDKDNPRAILSSHYIRYHTRGFDIVDIKISLSKKNKLVINVINKALEQTFPGARHHLDDNPTLYTFLALVHNKLGRIVRSKLGLDYAAFDRGNETVSISITEPAIETPPVEDTDKLDAEIQPDVETAPDGVAEMPGGMMGQAPGGMPPMGGGPDLNSSLGHGPMPGMNEITPETATPIGGAPQDEQAEGNPVENESEENIDDDIANIAKNIEF